jgi:hypothetical protein
MHFTSISFGKDAGAGFLGKVFIHAVCKNPYLFRNIFK